MTKEYVEWILKRFLFICKYSSMQLMLPCDIRRAISLTRHHLLNNNYLNHLHKLDREFGYDVYSMLVVDIRYAISHSNNKELKKLIGEDKVKWIIDHRNCIVHGRKELNETFYYDPIKIWEIISTMIRYVFPNEEIKNVIWKYLEQI